MTKRVLWMVLGLGIVSAAVGGGAAWQYHKQPSFCGICHVMDTYLESWESPESLAGAHAEAGVECLDCHEATVQQQVEELIQTVTKDYETPLKQREFEREWCLDCHEHGSQEELIERTSDYVYGFTETVNPHEWRVDIMAEDPHDTEEGLVECYLCHDMHRESLGVKYCFSCHHQRNFVACDNCHEE